MPATVEILTIPLGSQLTSTISGTDKEDKNDFPVLFLFSENVNLTESGITVSAGATLVSLEGANSVWMGRVRPPQTSGTVTVTVIANAVSQGNPRTSKAIRVSRFFPDAEAEAPQLLFQHNVPQRHTGRRVSGGPARGIATAPGRILISSGYDFGNNSGRSYIDFFTYPGVHKTDETLTINDNHVNLRIRRIDFLNGDLLYTHQRFTEVGYGRLDLQTLAWQTHRRSVGGITHTRLGVVIAVGSDEIFLRPYDFEASVFRKELDTNLQSSAPNMAHQNDLLYLYGTKSSLLEIRDNDEIGVIASLNIESTADNSTVNDIAIHRDRLYLVTSTGVYTLDIRKYRPVAKNTKSTIYPVFIDAGERLNLKQFAPDAERIVFDVGYDKPPFLTINSSSELVVGSGAQTCLVKLKAINRIDATETDSFQFYLIVRRTAAPVWRNVSELTMRAGSNYDLFQLVDAESIAFRSGRTRLAGSRLSNGIFTVGTEGGVAEFTAQKGSQSAHIAIHIDVVSEIGVGTAAVSGYRVEIDGIDVTADVLEFPSVSETLDPIVINEYRVNEAAITLRNEGGKYNSDLAGNFWETNGLNAGGFQNGVKIYTKHDGRGDLDPTENLLFSGVINESFEPIKEATFKLNCTDISSRLRKALAQNFGTLEKWDALRKQSDEDSYAGIYVPEQSLLPMQVGTGEARNHLTDLEISRLELPSEGPAAENTGYMTPNEFRTAGGFLPENPLLGFKAAHRSEDVRFLINQLAINKEVYNTEINIPGVEVEDPFLLNRGSMAFSIERTRMTRLPVDWVHDSSNNRILILLSNPEDHIADLLVQYDIGSDSYRVLHTFGKGVAGHRIERRSGTNYYILTSKKITQDRSARQLPRPTDATGYAYDSLAEGSAIKIYHYNTSTGNLTEHVAENDSFPPQLGIHYWVGFENGLYIDEFEGIRPDDREAFKWHSNNLYYRYAKDGEFGVARVDASGTTMQMIGQPRRGYWDHLNFAFDVNSSGTLYFAYLNNDAIFTVVESTSTRSSNVPIANDLSGVNAALQLQVSIRGASVPGVNAGPFITITGTDAGGDPQTVRLSGNRLQSNNRYFSTGVVNIGERFLTITDVAVGGYLSGTFTITTYGTNTALVVKSRTSDGTESTVLTDVSVLRDLTVLDAIGGSYLGALECLFHNNHLYLLVPIQRLDLAESATRTDARPTFRIEIKDTGMTGERFVTGSTNLNPTSTRLAPGNEIPVRIDFNGTVSGATRNDVTITGGTLSAFSISSDMIDITIRPSETRFHKNITIHLAQNAVDQRNEETHIVLDFGVENSRSRNRTKSAGLVLYRCNVTAANPSLTVVDTWDFVHQAGCNLTVHDGNVHYVEQPRAATVFKPINPDIKGYWTDDAETETMGYNILPEALGALKKVSSSGEVEHLGNVWFTDRPYNVFPTRMLSIDNDLHLCVGYGNGDEVLRYNSLASHADNMVHIVYGRTLHYVLPRFSPSGSLYAALASLAKSVNATLSFEKNVIMISDRRPYRALADGATGTGTGDLSFSDTNKAFPSSGYLLIGKEILRYSGITGGAFTGVQRGILGSPIADHADDSEILYLNNLIQTEKLGSPYKAITLQSDTNRIFNIIRDSGGVAEVRDEDSIALYGERPYTLELGLTRHEKAWIEEIFKSYLEELKDLQQIVNIQVIPDDSLRLGQIVPFFYKDLIRAMRIVSVRYERRATHIKGRTV